MAKIATILSYVVSVLLNITFILWIVTGMPGFVKVAPAVRAEVCESKVNATYPHPACVMLKAQETSFAIWIHRKVLAAVG